VRPRAEPGPRPADTVALGLLQGPAELLPVSSTAHVELLGARQVLADIPGRIDCDRGSGVGICDKEAGVTQLLRAKDLDLW
jgi:hypothetical protein